jgi:chemotaxis receptor (MCP) glutamine deamidase CheD
MIGITWLSKQIKSISSTPEGSCVHAMVKRKRKTGMGILVHMCLSNERVLYSKINNNRLQWFNNTKKSDRISRIFYAQK